MANSNIPPVGTEVYDMHGDKWSVYLEDVPVSCVRLVRLVNGANVYQDVPHTSWKYSEEDDTPFGE